MLQCTHHLCASHIGNLSSLDGIQCPVCSDTTVVGEGLQVDRTLKMVVERWVQQQERSTRSPSGREVPTCGLCDGIAVKRCVQCSGNLCEACLQGVHSQGFFKGHTTVELDQENPDAESQSVMLCDEHQDERLSFYCLDCRRPVCSHCLILGDHQGHQQTRIGQAFETGKETVQAWVEKLAQRMCETESAFEMLTTAEQEVNRNAEAQRRKINEEMDHMRDLIETKRQQLLSKSSLEERQKRMALQSHVDKVQSLRSEAVRLTARSEGLLGLSNEHAFLAVVLPLIQEMKKLSVQVVEPVPQLSGFRPLLTDAQVRALGDLDLGAPRPQQHPASVAQMRPQGALPPGYAQASPVNATLPFIPQGAVAMTQQQIALQPGMPLQQVQYVMRA